jgi:hypothetical protein
MPAKNITKKTGPAESPAKPVSIDEWFAAQDKAVDKTHARIRKKRNAAKTEAIPEAIWDDATRAGRTQHLISTLNNCLERRVLLEEEGWNIDWVRTTVHVLEEINDILLGMFLGGNLDTENHEIKVIQEMSNGKRISRVVIDGQSAL